MNVRRESIIGRVFVRLVVDPLLLSGRSSQKLKSNAASGAHWVSVLFQKVIDPTFLPPPGYLRKRADCVYGSAFLRCVEFVEKNHIQGDALGFGSGRFLVIRRGGGPT